MLKINDSVKVKQGIKDPDSEKYDLGGWQGHIIEIHELGGELPIITVVWDSITLKAMPSEFIEECIRDGFGFEEMNLSEDEVELAEARNQGPDRREAVQFIEQAYSWADFGEQGRRIKAVEDACEKDYFIMQHWFEHLEDNLIIPCTAIYRGDSNKKLRNGAEITINGFVDADDDYGVIGSAIYNRSWIQVLLCDVEPVEKTKNTEALSDYAVWFANR